MQSADTIALVAAGLILAKWVVELLLGLVNEQHVLRHADVVPTAFRDIIDPPTYAKSVRYTVAKARFGRVHDAYATLVLLMVLFSGVLPAALSGLTRAWGTSAWSMAAGLFLVGAAFWLASLPFEWFAQFKLEERFEFNTTTPRTWWMDRLKGGLLAVALGYPLLVLILKLVDWGGDLWWLWAWGVLMAFQLLMTIVAPVLILPLFNKFTPLPEGTLRERLLNLAQRTQFQAKSIQVMDGSRRSRHSNAFFTGIGRLRKIVLFDTLVAQLSEPELEAVLAHEIGHFRKKHIPKMMFFSAATSLGAFYVISELAQHAGFLRAFGFEPSDNVAPAVLLFSLLSGVVTFWFSPLAHWWSRKFEYEADAFAADAMREAGSLVGALRKLNEKNLSNLTPHPLYSNFYYSHPTLLEREGALARSGGVEALKG